MARKNDRRRPTVVSRRHGAWPFQTGRVIASLLRRGLTMEQATEVGREVRQAIGHAERVESSVVVGLVADALARRGWSSWIESRAAEAPADGLRVRIDGEVAAFPRHVLLRDLVAIGVDVARAGPLVDAVHDEISGRGSEATEEDVGNAVEARLDGSSFLRRWRLIEFIRRSSAPVVILLGGATGTGKSTLASELGFRLGIRRTVSTDMVRETMRAVLAPAIVPGLHDHSFRGIVEAEGLLDPQAGVVAGFRQQAAQVAVGVRAIIRRAVVEGTHVLVEGTHLVPPFAEFLPKNNRVVSAGMVLAVPSAEGHRDRFPSRPGSRDTAPATDGFGAVRWVHDHLLHAAEESDALVLVAAAPDQAPLYAMDLLAQALVPPTHGR